MIVSPLRLGEALRWRPVAPTSVATLLGNHQALLAFRRIVQDIFPGQIAEEILAAREEGASRENARVGAFLHRIEADLFPVYELEEYDQVLAGIPFIRDGWSYDDRFHDLDLRPGELLLFALCEQPFDPGLDTRIALLDAAQTHVPLALLQELPEDGISPAVLHQRLDGTPYAAAGEYADWLWGDTDSAFLDVSDDMEVSDADWTPENVQLLAEQWRRALGILDRIGKLTAWLEEDAPTHFARLLDAALGRDPGLDYEHQRRLYACEITPAGLVAIAHDEP